MTVFPVSGSGSAVFVLFVPFSVRSNQIIYFFILK